VNAQLLDYLSSRQIRINGLKVLEFGCRDGTSFMSFLKAGAGEIVGIDIDGEAIALSKMIFRDLGFDNLCYRVSDRDHPLPIQSKEFDLVSCNAIIEHLSPAQRPRYIHELQQSVRPGGYFIISDTPNRFWFKDGHTTGIWFLNYFPLAVKCWLGSQSKRWRGKLSWRDVDAWIAEGIEGVGYPDLLGLFPEREWSNLHDLGFRGEYKKRIFNLFPTHDPAKLVFRYILYGASKFIDWFYLQQKGYPSLAMADSLVCSFRLRKTAFDSTESGFG
jgi:SAM-dependent methyltransferase